MVQLSFRTLLSACACGLRFTASSWQRTNTKVGNGRHLHVQKDISHVVGGRMGLSGVVNEPGALVCDLAFLVGIGEECKDACNTPNGLRL